ncbi:hypothetical protein BN1723_011453 [Verticillium longisporum]|uniref:Vacuolar protein 14 C-terminal Fig4-binding domain-containing protein n=1 Tax=Verticillium longisporum TaxID=100787 RepID=A0A0G4L7J6_VERLO|nr:hypothetical protein BN1723_011453 [Verticillium longisporum]
MHVNISTLAVAAALFATPLVSALSADSIPSDLPVSELLSSAQSHLSKGETSDALLYYDAAVARDPSNYLTFFKRATTYLSLGRTSQATEDYNRVLSLKPDFEGAHIQLAKIRARSADWEGAKEHYKLANKDAASPELAALDEAQGAAQLAEAAERAGDFETCVHQAGEAIMTANRAVYLRELRVHHIVTNSPEHDPDIEHMPFFAVSHRLLGNLYSTYYDRLMKYDAFAKVMLSVQSKTYYPIMLFGRFNLYVLSWDHLIAGRAPRHGPAWWHRWLEVVGQAFFWTWFGYGIVYRCIPTAWDRVVFVIVSHMLQAPLHIQITLSHFAMSTADLGPAESFPQKMLRTTMDVDCPTWLDFFHGGLQFQAIHHLCLPWQVAPSRFVKPQSGSTVYHHQSRLPTFGERPDGTVSARASLSSSRELDVRSPTPAHNRSISTPSAVPSSAHPQADLDYAAAVSALTLLFLNDHEATRVAALTWLIMLHRKAPRKVLAFNDGTFPALLKTLSDPAEAVVTKDLQLLSQISRNSEDDYFSNFMVNLLQLFATDRKLLETRGNLIIRQLCVSLSAERIYRTLADCIEKEEDVEFASIMVQILNNNLITAPELADLRKRLRNLETKDGQAFFVALFRSWCYNAVATFSLCLLAQAYEQAYNLLQIFAELEMTVNILIQIDKLVQLIESPVFTYLRLQLLEPEKFPYLYKCLYGLLMLLPQSSAFAALKNRLNSVSSIGYLHITPRPTASTSAGANFDRPNRLKGREEAIIKWGDLLEKFRNLRLQLLEPEKFPYLYKCLYGLLMLLPQSSAFAALKNRLNSVSSIGYLHITPRPTASTSAGANFDRPNRLKGREEAIVKWGDLLEKFRSVQEKARRTQRHAGEGLDDGAPLGVGDIRLSDGPEMKGGSKDTRNMPGPPVPMKDPSTVPPPAAPAAKRSGLGRQLGRFGGAVAGRGKRP